MPLDYSILAPPSACAYDVFTVYIMLLDTIVVVVCDCFMLLDTIVVVCDCFMLLDNIVVVCD